MTNAYTIIEKDVDILLVGAGIMSSTLGPFIKTVRP